MAWADFSLAGAVLQSDNTMWFTKSSNRFDFEHYHEPAVENLPGIPLNFSHFDQSRALWRAREVGWVGGWHGDAVAFRFQSPPVEPFMWNST